MAKEMDRRRQAARAADGIAFDLGTAPDHDVALGVELDELRAAHRPAADRVGNAIAGHHVDARAARTLLPLGVDALARIDEDDARTGTREIAGALIGVIVAGEEQDTLADGDGVAVEVGGDRGGGEDARQVVVAENQRPLDGPGREHDAVGADAVQALARLAVRAARTAAGDPASCSTAWIMFMSCSAKAPVRVMSLTLGRLRSSPRMSASHSLAVLPADDGLGADRSQPPGSFCSSRSMTP